MSYAVRFIAFVCAGFLLLALLITGGLGRLKAPTDGLAVQRELVARLGLTDLCLFTEAPYTRHLTLATPAQPFLDHPLATAHFPTGSLVAPPRHLFPRAQGVEP